MVFFTCNACGSSLKKNQVEKHYQCECPRCEVLSCMDCGKDFYGDEYVTHTKCVSEAEKYQGGLFKERGKAGSVGKGEKKQQEWLERVQQLVKSSTKVNPRIARLLEKAAQYPNIPRKKAKFQNFVKNSINVRDQQTLEELWELFSTAIKPATVDANGDGSSVVDENAGGVTVDSGTNNTPSPPKKEKNQKVKSIKERHKLEAVSDSAPEVVTKPKKSKTKKKGKLEAEESQDPVAEEELDTSSQTEQVVFAHKMKNKKKRKRESSDLSPHNPTTEESVPSHNSTAESCGEETCEKNECEFSAELAPSKKKRKKLKKRETVGEDYVSTEREGENEHSIDPMEVAREYINGCQSLEGVAVDSDVVQEGEKKPSKKGRKKSGGPRAKEMLEDKEDVVQEQVGQKTKSKKHKKHKH